jgi:hypothetical protein
MPTLRQYLLLALLWAFVGWACLWGWTCIACDPASPERWCDAEALRREGRWVAATGAYYVGRAPLVGFVMGLLAAPSLTACSPRLPTLRKVLLHAGIWALACLGTVAHWHQVTQDLSVATRAYLPWAPLAGGLAGIVASPVLGAPVERRVPGVAGRVLGIANDAISAVIILGTATLALVALASPRGYASDSYGVFDVKTLVQTWTGLIWESSPWVLLGTLGAAATASDLVGHMPGRALTSLPSGVRRAVAIATLHLHHALVALLVMLIGTVSLLLLWPHHNPWDDLRKALKWSAIFWSKKGWSLVGVGVLASFASRWIVVRFAARADDVPDVGDTLGEGTEELPRTPTA